MDPAVVDVAFEERYWYPHDGGVVWVAGYQLVDPAVGPLPRARRARGRRCRASSLRPSPAPGATTRRRSPTRTPSAPGRPLALRRDPDNEHDPNAIAVHPEGGGEQLGWVPREVGRDVAADLDAGRPWAAVALRERRASPRDPRTGLTMLLAPARAIELRVRAG